MKFNSSVEMIVTLLLFFCLVSGSSVFAAEGTMSGGGQDLTVDSGVERDLSADDFEDEFSDEFPEEEALIGDPLEGFNRAMFWFNDRMYFYLLKPVARGYRYVPSGVRRSVGNFFDNLEAPVRAVNCILQWRLGDAAEEVWRFAINSTVGVFGLFDMTGGTGLDGAREDFGQTLGSYGLGSGPYLVLPFTGPSSLRDTFGNIVDGRVDPIYVQTDTTRDAVSIKLFATVNTLSLDKDTYEGIKRDALDPYTFVKNAYAQLRQRRVKK